MAREGLLPRVTASVGRPQARLGQADALAKIERGAARGKGGACGDGRIRPVKARALILIAAAGAGRGGGGDAVCVAYSGLARRLLKPTYYQDVKPPILDLRCAGCHFSGGIAPSRSRPTRRPGAAATRSRTRSGCGTCRRGSRTAACGRTSTTRR